MSNFKVVQGNFVAKLHQIPLFPILCNHFKIKQILRWKFFISDKNQNQQELTIQIKQNHSIEYWYVTFALYLFSVRSLRMVLLVFFFFFFLWTTIGLRKSMHRSSSIIFLKKLIIYIHYNLILLHLPIIKKTQGCDEYYVLVVEINFHYTHRFFCDQRMQ